MKKNIEYIFLFHNGNSGNYLKYAIEETVKNNKNRKVVLLGNEENDIFNNILHVNIDDYSNYANEFVENFIFLGNKSVIDYFPLLMSFKRWFVILEYMQKNNISDGYYQDSDIIMNCNLDDLDYDDEYWHCVKGEYAPAAFSIKLLAEFCKFIFRCFTEEEKLLHLFNVRLNYKVASSMPFSCGWNVISDMELMKLFFLEEKIPYKIISTKGNNSIFSLAVYAEFYSTPQGIHEFIMHESNGCYFNNFYYKDNEIFVKSISLDKFIKVDTVHFAGKIKEHIEPFMKYRELSDKKLKYYNFKSQEWRKEEEVNYLTKYLALKETIEFLRENKNETVKWKILNTIMKFYNIKRNEFNCTINDAFDFLIETVKRKAYEKLNQKLENKKLIGWGSGGGLDILTEWHDCDFKFEYLVDANKDKCGQKKNGINIRYIDQLLNEEKNDIVIIVLSESYYHEIKKQLILMGFEENKNFISMRQIALWIEGE